jgi:hypothetical protein
MPFGLTNAPSTFQMMMNDLFHIEIAQCWLKVYMNDILVATSGSHEEHLQHVCIILQCLQDNNLFLKPEKCHFTQSSVDYLGVVISCEGIAMDLVKLAGILNWPTPTSVTEICLFLGFGNFYKLFIADYAKITWPLHDLTKKGVTFSWMDKANGAFLMLKDCFCPNQSSQQSTTQSLSHCKLMPQPLPLV